MRRRLSLSILTILAACTSGRADIGGVANPKGATGVMYTNTPTQQVAECVARALNQPAQSTGTAISIASAVPDRVVRYDVMSAPVKSGYRTMVAINGDVAQSDETVKVTSCL